MAMCPDGGLLMLGSSVHRKVGYMYRQYRKLHGNDDTDSLRSTATMFAWSPAKLIGKSLDVLPY